MKYRAPVIPSQHMKKGYGKIIGKIGNRKIRSFSVLCKECKRMAFHELDCPFNKQDNVFS